MRHLLLCFVAILAASISEGASVRAEGRIVVVNEVPTIRFARRSGNVDGEVRARSVANMLATVYDSNVAVGHQGRQASLKVGNVTLITVDAREAKFYGVSAYALLNTWAKPLRAALALPAFRLSATSLRLGPSTSKDIRVVGSGVQGCQITCSDSSVASVSRLKGALTIQSLRPGLAQVLLTSGQSTASVRVRVLPYAAEFPQTIRANVTGAPATVETVRGAIRSSLLTQFPRQPGGRLAYRIDRVTSVPTGEDRVFTITVRATAPDAVATEGPVNVSVQNSALTNAQDEELWFCNKPESVPGPGELFSATLKPDRPVRMLYHHFNASGSELVLRVTAVNATDKPAELWLIPGDSAPTSNPALAGMRAADQFARNWVCNSGEIVRIPAHMSMPIAVHRLFQGQTMSGLCSMRLLGGGPPGLRILAAATIPFPPDDAWRAALSSSTPWREVGAQPIRGKILDELRPSDHIYGRPFLDKEFDFTVGKPNSIVRLGADEIAKHGTGEKLGGNYGVIYNLRTSLDNPTKEPVEVELMYRASGGYSGGVFLIDGTVVRTKLLNPDQEVCVTTFRVEAGLRRFLMIQTLPLSGGSYPATITLRTKTGVALASPSALKK